MQIFFYVNLLLFLNCFFIIFLDVYRDIRQHFPRRRGLYNNRNAKFFFLWFLRRKWCIVTFNTVILFPKALRKLYFYSYRKCDTYTWNDDWSTKVLTNNTFSHLRSCRPNPKRLRLRSNFPKKKCFVCWTRNLESRRDAARKTIKNTLVAVEYVRIIDRKNFLKNGKRQITWSKKWVSYDERTNIRSSRPISNCRRYY